MLILGLCLFAMIQDFEPKFPPLTTPWTDKAKPGKTHQEHPRPQMTRKDWANLNGLWDYSVVPIGAAQPAAWQGKIHVPFPIESALSGVQRALLPTEALWYRRAVVVPAKWSGRRVWLRFGAVDWSCEVWVNGKSVGSHKGGYDPFSFDVSDALALGRSNEIVVKVTDPTDTQPIARGKQVLKPEGIWYTPNSGIWQSVWLEPVHDKGVESARFEWIEGERVVVHAGAGGSMRLTVLEGRKRVVSETVVPGRPFEFSVPSPRLWSPESPFLYNYRLEVLGAGKVVDQVDGYFGLRRIEVKRDEEGVNRIHLNGRPIFVHGPLDQGFWPDGIYTAPTDEALKFDLDMTKKMGFNSVRKHVKVEPARWYYWCDKLGLMVMQDMPNTMLSGDNPEAKGQFEIELKTMIEALRVHPSIVMWVPFNEGWGQYDTVRIAKMVKELDPSRLVNNASGWTDAGAGDAMDIHVYPGPGMPPLEPKRAAMLGEYGGLGLPLSGHTWQDEKNWGYRSYQTKAELQKAYIELQEQLRLLAAQGLTAAVYTQTTDVEIEVNGLMTYDRKVVKIDPERVKKHNALLAKPISIDWIVSTAQASKNDWAFSTTKPGDGWFSPNFDDTEWGKGVGGFGTKGTPGAIIGTEWNTQDIWIRRSFQSERPIKGLSLAIHHDEDAEVYLNGQLVAELKGYTTAYKFVAIKGEIKAGKNVLAVHCRQTTGGQYIDAGLAILREGL